MIDLSALAESNFLESFEMLREVIFPLWPTPPQQLNIELLLAPRPSVFINLPVATSQTFIEASELPLTILVSSELNLTQFTSSL